MRPDEFTHPGKEREREVEVGLGQTDRDTHKGGEGRNRLRPCNREMELAATWIPGQEVVLSIGSNFFFLKDWILLCSSNWSGITKKLRPPLNSSFCSAS